MKNRIYQPLTVLILTMFISSIGVTQEQKQNDDKKDDSPIVTSTMKMGLTGGMKLQGSPVDMDIIKINSLFGEASLPLHTVAGIRFAQKPGEQTTIVLQNGDVLTGQLAMDTMKCVAEWGQATVNTTHIEYVVFRPDLTWSPVNTPQGQRWRLTRVTNTMTPPTRNSSRVYQP